jgi:hypothetical protein
MKFTSIVFAALVAATQFSSTLAAQSSNPEADTATTAFDTAVTIDVFTNDKVQRSVGAPLILSVETALAQTHILSYVLTKSTTATASHGTVDVVDGKVGVPCSLTLAGTPDTFKYTPNTGFVGEDEFEYTFMVTHPSPTPGDPYGTTTDSNPVKVTVTVSPEATIKQTFEIPGVVSSGNAIKYNHEALFNIVAVTPTAPDTEAFTAIVKPVFGGSADFAANTSPEAVDNIAAKSWNSFIKFFRGNN